LNGPASRCWRHCEGRKRLAIEFPDLALLSSEEVLFPVFVEAPVVQKFVEVSAGIEGGTGFSLSSFANLIKSFLWVG
jgi:hypothetical protein